MKKILIMTNEFYPFKGGIGRYCEELIAVLKKNNNVTLIAPKYDGSLKDTCLSDNITLNLAPGGQFKYWHFPKLIKKVMSVSFNEYDFVLVADWPFWMAIEFVNRFFWGKKIRYSLMLHGSEVLNLKNGKASIFNGFLNIFSGTEKIFTNSKFTKKILYDNHTVPRDIPVVVTYLGVSNNVNLNNFHYISSITNNPFDILTVGRLDERKGFDHVINAIGLLPGEIRENIRYTIIGNGTDEFKGKLENLAKINNVSLSILSGVNDEELQELYIKHKVFILAAKKSDKKVEGFGLVFLEAAKYGLPSIATDVGAISEVVKDNYTGLVVKENVQDISEAIYKVYNSRELLVAFSHNCIKEVPNFSWEKLAALTLG
ncbi:MAG: glycosyltransferase family 4 protein [Pantoea sp.]|uniref:glycosyltransferase family 4 protein n=1 Tax=Pantoea sp. TaxID=69393 RepID=UPI0039E4755D